MKTSNYKRLFYKCFLFFIKIIPQHKSAIRSANGKDNQTQSIPSILGRVKIPIIINRILLPIEIILASIDFSID